MPLGAEEGSNQQQTDRTERSSGRGVLVLYRGVLNVERRDQLRIELGVSTALFAREGQSFLDNLIAGFRPIPSILSR